MRILLDECAPAPLRKLLASHECRTAKEMGWSGFKNGELLSLAESQFDLFLTTDQNLQYQQNLTGRTIAILVLSTNDWRRIKAASGLIAAEIAGMQPGEYREFLVP